VNLLREHLKKRRIELRLTHEDIAEKVGIKRSTYTNIELGRKNPSFDVLIKLKKVLETNDDTIFLDSINI